MDQIKRIQTNNKKRLQDVFFLVFSNFIFISLIPSTSSSKRRNHDVSRLFIFLQKRKEKRKNLCLSETAKRETFSRLPPDFSISLRHCVRSRGEEERRWSLKEELGYGRRKDVFNSNPPFPHSFSNFSTA